jgi:hypothetical protein
MGLLGVARANTAVGVSPETFLLLLLLQTVSPQCPQPNSSPSAQNSMLWWQTTKLMYMHAFGG